MTDAELEAHLDGMNATDEQRAMARQIIDTQRAAVERGEREDEQRQFQFAHLPRYMRRAALAEHEGLRLQSEGADLDAIERRLFDGIARDAPSSHVVRRARELRGARGDFDRCAIGTQALLSATLDGSERGTDAARDAFTKIQGEADAFGRALTATMLRGAGWQDEDLT